MLKADIRFANGSVIRCIGRVVDGKGKHWTDEADLRAHIAYINDKNPDLPQPLEIVRIIYE